MKRKYPFGVGQNFTRWTVVAHEPSALKALCRCSCGTEREVNVGNLVQGLTTSCGCLKREKAIERGKANTKHGLSRTPLYQTWHAMHRRATQTTAKDWPYYGGRGITLYEPWHDPAAFIAWITENLGPRPSGFTLDRIDPERNYEPGNLRWASRSEQSRNQRPRAPGLKRRTRPRMG